VPTAIVLFGNPIRARDLHVHRLSPRRVRPHLSGTSLSVVRSRLHFLLTPQFITVLRKRASPAFAPHNAPPRCRSILGQ
jgi:hypothetical protein